jgi:hypothetical protein
MFADQNMANCFGFNRIISFGTGSLFERGQAAPDTMLVGKGLVIEGPF